MTREDAELVRLGCAQQCFLHAVVLGVCLREDDQTDSSHKCMHYVFGSLLCRHWLSLCHSKLEIVATLDQKHTCIKTALKPLLHLSTFSSKLDWESEASSLEKFACFVQHLTWQSVIIDNKVEVLDCNFILFRLFEATLGLLLFLVLTLFWQSFKNWIEICNRDLSIKSKFCHHRRHSLLITLFNKQQDTL